MPTLFDFIVITLGIAYGVVFCARSIWRALVDARDIIIGR